MEKANVVMEKQNDLNIIFRISYDYNTSDEMFVAIHKMSLPAENGRLAKVLQGKYKLMNEYMTESWGIYEDKILEKKLPKDIANNEYRTMVQILESKTIVDLTQMVADRKKELISLIREFFFHNKFKISITPSDNVEVIPII